MTSDDLTMRLPGGGILRVIGPIGIETRAGACLAACRRCGRELGRWTVGGQGPPLRCACPPVIGASSPTSSSGLLG